MKSGAISRISPIIRLSDSQNFTVCFLQSKGVRIWKVAIKRYSHTFLARLAPPPEHQFLLNTLSGFSATVLSHIRSQQNPKSDPNNESRTSAISTPAADDCVLVPSRKATNLFATDSGFSAIKSLHATIRRQSACNVISETSYANGSTAYTMLCTPFSMGYVLYTLYTIQCI